MKYFSDIQYNNQETNSTSEIDTKENIQESENSMIIEESKMEVGANYHFYVVGIGS